MWRALYMPVWSCIFSQIPWWNQWLSNSVGFVFCWKNWPCVVSSLRWRVWVNTYSMVSWRKALQRCSQEWLKGFLDLSLINRPMYQNNMLNVCPAYSGENPENNAITWINWRVDIIDSWLLMNDVSLCGIVETNKSLTMNKWMKINDPRLWHFNLRQEILHKKSE